MPAAMHSSSSNNNNASLSASTHECTIVSAILLDELEKTDKLKNIKKLRKSISRSVSYVKNTLRRNNSKESLSGSSMHSNASSHNSSFASLDSYHTSNILNDSDDGSLSDPDNNNDNGVPKLRSCLKGKNKNSAKRCTKKFVVRFKNRHKEHKIEPYFEYAKDLWYTTSNEKAAFLSPQLETVSETVNAEQYMVSYTCARKQVYPKEWFEMKEPKVMNTPSNNNNTSYTKMLISNYNDIVYGRKSGFAGFEQYSANLKKRRMVHIKSVVLMVCAAYYDCKNNGGTSRIQHQQKDNGGPISDETIARLVQKYSKSLSEADRYWATAMGQADYDVALEIYNTNNPQKIISTTKSKTTSSSSHHPTKSSASQHSQMTKSIATNKSNSSRQLSSDDDDDDDDADADEFA